MVRLAAAAVAGIAAGSLLLVPVSGHEAGWHRPVQLATHPETVDDPTGRFVQLSVSDNTDTVLARLMDRSPWLGPERNERPSAELAARFVPGSADGIAYVDLERGRLNADGLARRLLGQPTAVVGVIDAPGGADVRPGELLLAVDGVAVPVRGLADLWHDQGVLFADEATLTVADPDRFVTRQVTVAWDALPFWQPALVSADPLRVTVTGTIGGSGGLVQFLAVLDALEPGDLTGGRVVAATGGVAVDGDVTGVDGVPAKAAAADRSDADVLFVPAGEGAAAATSLPVVEVDTVLDAVAWLCANGGVSSVCVADPTWTVDVLNVFGDPTEPLLPAPPTVTPAAR